MQQATAEQLATWKERAGLAETRLAKLVKEHEQAIAHLSTRYAARSRQDVTCVIHAVYNIGRHFE